MSLRNRTINILRSLGLMSLIGYFHQRWLNFLKWTCRVRGKSHMEVIYNDRYFDAEEAWTNPSAREVVEIIAREFSPSSLADIGCGTGVYLPHFHAKHIKATGFEGSMAAIRKARVSPEFIQHCDLTKQVQPPRTFDLAICFEVAEHLPFSASDMLVSNLTRFSNVILFSAAQPGQGGVDHINEQPCSFWQSKFEANDYLMDETKTSKLRLLFKQQGSVWWLEKNLMVFRKNISST